MGIRLGLRIGAIVTVAVAVGVIGSVEPTTSAYASNFGVELNGTYRVISNGDWAKSNEVFLDEKTVVQTWTVTSSCTSPIMCTGTVTSDQGWSAPMRTTGDYWSVDRIVENWMPCPDGTAAAGAQNFKFWGWDPVNSYRNLKIVDLLAGKNRTVAASGACGVNRPLVIELPMRLEKVS
ncbi:hypothetical protein GGC64_005190 [Mycobacterium sp. OAS707]|uniref:hypothetical protein n=1 Tax=Mycobacterium sp. OAS707 TaxID=2663822 RepID=UPI0019F21A93|nr:hypothetical protein [Mycobacterium sp. OAS707]